MAFAMLPRRHSVVIGVLFGIAALTHASIFQGKAAMVLGQGSGTEFVFLGKFCFDGASSARSGTGLLAGWVSTPQFGVSLAIYDDELNFYSYIHHNHSCSCSCKLQQGAGGAAKYVLPIEPVELDHKLPMPFRIPIPLADHPRFWYVVLAKCNSLPVGVYADYMLEATQPGGSQVPVNEAGLRTLYAVASALWLGLVGLQVVAAVKMLRAGVFHPLAKLLASSTVMYFLRNVFMLMHWSVLARNGRGNPLLEGLAHVSSAFVRVQMLLLLMLIAKGWTISTTQIPQKKKLILGIMLNGSNYCLLMLWDFFSRDPASSIYMYDSAPGLGIAFTHVIFLLWFSSTIHSTLQLEHSPVRRKFFFEVWATYTFYLLILPCACVVSTFLRAWQRQKAVEYVLELCNTATYFHLAYIMWPSRAPTYFQRLYVSGSRAGKGSNIDAEERSSMLPQSGHGGFQHQGGARAGLGGSGHDQFAAITGHARFDEL